MEKKKVLVVDNNPLILEQMQQLLEQDNGHEVVTADDGSSVYTILRDFSPQIIFLDLETPQINAADLCRTIRQEPDLKTSYIIIISKNGSDSEISFQSLGADAYVSIEPFAKATEHIKTILKLLEREEKTRLANKVLGIEKSQYEKNTSKLLSSRKHFEAILQNVSDGVIELTNKGNIVYITPKASSFLGIKETLLLSSHFSQYFSGAAQNRIEEALENLNGTTQFTGKNETLKINARTLQVNVTPICDGTYRSVLVTLSDITSRKSAEKKAKRSYQVQQLLNRLLNLSLLEETIQDVLEQFIIHLTEIPWLNLEPTGIVFLVEPESGALVQRAHYGIDHFKTEICRSVSDNRCFCGMAAESRQVIYAGPEDYNDTTCCHKMSPDGHYSVPILSAEKGNLLGVFSVHSKKNFPRNKEIETIFIAAGKALAGVIARMRAEQDLKQSEESYRSFARVGLNFSSEKDINRLLEMIVDEARELSNADAGTLYIVDKENQHLRFEILQNDTMETRLGGSTGDDITFPHIPLFKNNKANHDNVSSYVALTGEIINIPDVYEAVGFDFTGPRQYDAATGYRSKSMLVIPLKNYHGEIIGVLQLLNALASHSGQVIAFQEEYIDLVASLATQAAMALTNVQLVNDLEHLFYSFIKSIATAIDTKSPYTGGHIRRVYDLTMMIANKINESNEGKFAATNFSDNELEELRLAAWMHDVGKITTPEHVVDKATKLEAIFSRIDMVAARFDLIGEIKKNQYNQEKISLLQKGSCSNGVLHDMDERLNEELETMKDDLEFLKNCDCAGEFMSDDKIERVKDIAARTYEINGISHPYLTENEAYNLCIRKGTLNPEERSLIENHATVTREILNQLPFPQKMAKVPEYAAGHHERLDGTGYPLGLGEQDLPLQSRIMAVADIFEALTAKDRPYRQPMPLSQALRIMGFMSKDKHIDAEILELFVTSGLHIEYAKQEMDPDQIDITNGNTP